MAELRTIKRGNTWTYIFEISSQDGKRKRISKGGFKTKAAAIECGTKEKSEYDSTGIVAKQINISYHDYLQFWIKDYCYKNLKETTVKGYEKKIRLYIDPNIGKYSIKELNPKILSDFIFDMFNNGMSNNTLTSLKTIMSSSLRYAVNPLGYLKYNPMKDIRNPNKNATPKVATAHKERIAITKEQFEMIIERFPEGHPAHIPLQLGYRCGLRLGEAFAIDIEKNFDEVNRTLTIEKQIQNTGTGDNQWYLSDPKYNSHRTIDLDNTMYDIILRKKKQIEKDKLYYEDSYTYYSLEKKNGKELYIKDVDGEDKFNPLCRRENGTWCTPRIMQHTSYIIHKMEGLEKFDYHSLRHTHATNLVGAGADVKYVQNRLGHKNIETTLNIYTHLNKDVINKNINILNKM